MSCYTQYSKNAWFLFYVFLNFLLKKIKVAMFSAFHIVRLENAIRKMWLRTLQLGQFGIYKKIVSSLFFDVLKGCFEYKKSIFRKNYVPTLHVSEAIKIRW